MTTCSRTGCSKKLNKNNTTGVCGSNCLSLEAPLAKRAKSIDSTPGVARLTPAKVAKLADEKTGATLIKFRLVTEALGLNADEIIEDFAQGWLTAASKTLAEADEAAKKFMAEG